MGEEEKSLSHAELLAENRRQKVENENLIRQLTFDELTGLYRTTDYGRRAILEEICRARSNSRSIVLSKFDLRQFRQINNLYDYETGDQVLIVFAEELKKIIGNEGMGMRSHFRGDEFAILLFGVEQEATEQKLRELQETGVSWTTEKATGNITFTLGVASQEALEGHEWMNDGELFQNLWQVASEKERDEHRRING